MDLPPRPPAFLTAARSRAGAAARPAALAAVAAGLAALAGCAADTSLPSTGNAGAPALTPAEQRARIARAMPPGVADRAGWAADIHAALTTLRVPATASNACAVIAVIEQESSFRADPPVPGLATIAWREIDEQAQKLGVPSLLVRGALQLPSSDGRSYADRIDAARTERELSEIFDDLVGRVPLGRRLLAGRNPVRTGGPMQVAIGYAETHAADKPYPYPVGKSLRDEVFTRRGGVYFGVAHLLDYPASYGRPLYRFADFNAGHWASRNAALQQAISTLTGVALDLDGDLLPARPGPVQDGAAGATEAAARALGVRLGLDERAVRRDLEAGRGPDLERTPLWERAFALADRTMGAPQPRAVLPRITLRSPKITRGFTTERFALRVDERHQRCLARERAPAEAAAAPPSRPADPRVD